MTVGSRPVADVNVGDEVIVITGGSHRLHSPVRRTPARVTQAARVWLTAQDVAGLQTWRFRRDTQSEGDRRYTFTPRFVTPEQDRWDRVQADAREFLHEQGIDLRSSSPWNGREVELAAILRAAA